MVRVTRETAISQEGRNTIIEFNEEQMRVILEEAKRYPYIRIITNRIDLTFKSCLGLFYVSGMDEEASKFAEKYGKELKQQWQGADKEKEEIIGFLPVREYIARFIPNFGFYHPPRKKERYHGSHFFVPTVERFLDKYGLNKNLFLYYGWKPKDFLGEDEFVNNKLIRIAKFEGSNEITACEELMGRQLTEGELNKILIQEAEAVKKAYDGDGELINLKESFRFFDFDTKNIFLEREDCQEGKKVIFDAVLQYAQINLLSLMILNSGKELPEDTILKWMENYKKKK